MPSTARRLASAAIGGGESLTSLPPAERQLVVSKQSHLLDRQKRVAVFSTEFGKTIGHHVDHGPWTDGGSEAAADTEVERDIEVVPTDSTREHHDEVATIPTPVISTSMS